MGGDSWSFDSDPLPRKHSPLGAAGDRCSGIHAGRPCQRGGGKGAKGEWATIPSCGEKS